MSRGEVTDAARLEKNFSPRLSLDHIIKERYPTFIDALRDLDDALSMLFLFANLPSTTTVPPKTIARCQRLCLEFQQYLITTHALRKSFLSIKGIYYQATIQGQDILWLVPYKFVQRVTGDVDFRIMGTFVEFYTTLLGFVNYRLYTSAGLVYPPKFNASSDDRGGDLRALTLEGRSVTRSIMGVSASGNGTTETAVASKDTNGHGVESSMDADLSSVVQQIAAAEHEPDRSQREEQHAEEMIDTAVDTFEAPISTDADILPQPAAATETLATLFTHCTFYLSRETPRQPLELLLRAFGCKRIAWDVVLGDGSFTDDEHDTSITHQIVDRPALPVGAGPQTTLIADAGETAARTAIRTRVPGRTYIQPQWVWDCVNEGKLLRPDMYAPGAELPPHLSPWVRPGKGQYDPTAPLAEQEREGEAEEAEEDENEDDDEEDEEAASSADEDEIEGGMDVAGSSSSESESGPEDEWTGLNGHEHEEEEAEDGFPLLDPDASTKLHQLELEAEASGQAVKSGSSTAGGSTPGASIKAAAKRRRREQAEELERQKMMMSRKKRKMLEKMLHSNQKKDDQAEALRAKRRKIERQVERNKA